MQRRALIASITRKYHEDRPEGIKVHGHPDRSIRLLVNRRLFNDSGVRSPQSWSFAINPKGANRVIRLGVSVGQKIKILFADDLMNVTNTFRPHPAVGGEIRRNRVRGEHLIRRAPPYHPAL